MKTLLTILLFVSAIAVLTTGCKKDTSDNPTGTNTQQIDDFPNKVEYQWTYLAYDSSTQQIDTVKVKIVGQTTLSNGQPATIWQLNYATKTDTNYVSKNGDTIRVYDNYLPQLSIKDVYEFPMVIGKYWLTGYVTDTCKVIAKNSITVIGGNFQNAFDIERTAWGFNYSLYENIWFVPKVGVVKMYRKEFNLGPWKHETWELINYNFGQ